MNHQPKPGRDKIANYTNTRKTSKQHHRDGDDSVPGVHEHDSRHQNDKRNKGPERRGSYHEKKTKQHQRQSSVSGNESGEVKNSRYRKVKASVQEVNAPEAANEMKKKQHRRQGSITGNDLAKVREDRPQKTCDVTAESDCLSERAKKDEPQHTSLGRTKSVSKGSRRSTKRNSLKSIPTEVLADRGKDMTEKQTGNKSKQSTRSNTPSGRNSRKASCAEEEISGEPENENEVILKNILRFTI